MMRWTRRSPSVITIAAIAVAIGLLPLPYVYYMLLRIFLCGLSLYFLTRPTGMRDVEKWVLAGLVLLFNPIAPVELGSKPLWSIINIATVVLVLDAEPATLLRGVGRRERRVSVSYLFRRQGQVRQQPFRCGHHVGVGNQAVHAGPVDGRQVQPIRRSSLDGRDTSERGTTRDR